MGSMVVRVEIVCENPFRFEGAQAGPMIAQFGTRY